jgi:hypothetical protein
LSRCCATCGSKETEGLRSSGTAFPEIRLSVGAAEATIFSLGVAKGVRTARAETVIAR